MNNILKNDFKKILKKEDKEEYIFNVLESLDQSILILDKKGDIIIWNKITEKLFFKETYPFKKNIKELFPRLWEDYRGIVWGEILFKEVLQEGSIKKLRRYPIKTIEKKIRYFDLKGVPLKNKDGEIIGSILILTDVTDNIYLEKQLLRHARTASLADLGASIAHEIRNPLNAISLNIQLIKELILDESSSQSEILEILNDIISEINRLNELIKYFLKFSRLPEPKLSLQDLNECINQTLKLLNEEAKKSNIEIIKNLIPLPKIYIDKNQISQAIYNICLNAIQAMKEQGGGKLEITTLFNKDYVVIEIKDNGPGLETDKIDKLFDLFYTTKDEGSGLGLPISNQIVEKHGGKIVAENNLDRGACFSIYLPLNNKFSDIKCELNKI